MKDDDITRTIIGCAYKVHNALGTGFLEKVYENALRIELTKSASASNSRSPSLFCTRDKWLAISIQICGSTIG